MCPTKGIPECRDFTSSHTRLVLLCVSRCHFRDCVEFKLDVEILTFLTKDGVSCKTKLILCGLGPDECLSLLNKTPGSGDGRGRGWGGTHRHRCTMNSCRRTLNGSSGDVRPKERRRLCSPGLAQSETSRDVRTVPLLLSPTPRPYLPAHVVPSSGTLLFEVLSELTGEVGLS